MYLINALSFDGEWENIPMSDLLVYLDVKVVMDLIENKKDNVVYATIPKFSYGNKENDLAWAILLRPGQQFLKTIDEREKFWIFILNIVPSTEMPLITIQYYLEAIFIR